MPDHWSVTVDDADARRRIRILSAALNDLRPFWPIVARLVRGWWKLQFETEGEFAGQRWRPLSPAYAVWKARHHPGRGILEATGQLKQAASRPQRFQTPTTLTMTIDDAGPAHGPVLQYHQFGDGVPQRPLVFGDPLPPLAAVQLQDAADDYIRDLLRRV